MTSGVRSWVESGPDAYHPTPLEGIEMARQDTRRDQIARERAVRFQSEQWARAGRKSTAQDMRRAADSIRDTRRPSH